MNVYLGEKKEAEARWSYSARVVITWASVAQLHAHRARMEDWGRDRTRKSDCSHLYSAQN